MVFMRFLIISVLCFGAFFLTSCKEKPGVVEVVDYSIENVTGDLSKKDITSCFKALGLSFERFQVMLPERRVIKFSSKKFENGRPVGVSSSGTFLEKGLQQFMLFKRQEGSELKFSIGSPSGSSSFDTVYIEDYSTSTWGKIPIRKISEDEKQPIYFFAANKKSIESFPANNFDLEAMVAKYEFVMVIYISLAEKEN
jgi:hypothetical protein